MASACKSLAYSELRKLSQEYPLTRTRATTVADMLWERALDPGDTWHETTKASSDEWRWMMDRAYTDDGHGDRWLVLSYSDNVLESRQIGAARTGAWNVLSPLFNSRIVVAAKIGMKPESGRQTRRRTVKSWKFTGATLVIQRSACGM